MRSTVRTGAFPTILVLNLFAVTSAAAQSSYVTAAAGADLSRFGQVVTEGSKSNPPEGLVPAGAIRVGTAFGERWGVEAEMAFAGTFEKVSEGNFLQAVQGLNLRSNVSAIALYDITPQKFGDIAPSAPVELVYRSRTRRGNSTFSTVGWVSKPIGSRTDLVAVLGLALNRASVDTRLSLIVPRGLGSVSPASAQMISYGFGPLVGTEIRVRAGDRWRLVPSVRLHKLDASGAWLLRTNIGLSRTF